MYPDGELTQLAAHKFALRARIDRRRRACVGAAADLEQSLAWLDRLTAFWRRLGPLAKLAALPAALLLKRMLFPRRGFLARLVRWIPSAISAGRIFRALHPQAQSQR